MSFPKIIVISLKRSHDRRASIDKQMKQLGLKFEYFDAIDAEQLTDDDLKAYDEQMAMSDFGTILTRGEVACALSHFGVHEKIINENLERVIILEDDVAIGEDFLGVLRSRAKFPRDAELIFYHHGKAKSFPWRRKRIYKNYRIARYRAPTKHSKRSIVSAAAYELTRSGAEKMLRDAFPIKLPVDVHIGYIQRNRAVTYGIEPCCISIAGFETTIPGRIN